MISTDTIHDPRRPEVPKFDQEQGERDAAYIISRAKSGMIGTHDVALWLRAYHEQAAIAGMQAQYKHDHKDE
jgi:hypothetical protein